MSTYVNGIVFVEKDQYDKNLLLSFPIAPNEIYLSLAIPEYAENDDSYRVGVSFKLQSHRFNDLISFFRQLSLTSVWIQWFDHGSLNFLKMEDGVVVYEVSGTICTEDTMRDAIPGLDAACKKTNFVEFDNGNGQVFVRKFEDGKSDFIFDGSIVCDSRKNKDHLVVYHSSSEM